MGSSYILIVDDEPFLPVLYQQALTELGHTVRVATSGTSGLELIAAEGLPSVILLDCKMHGMSGERFVDELIARGFDRPRVKIVGFSSHSPCSPLIESFVAKIDGYAEKPETLDDLVSRVAEYLNS